MKRITALGLEHLEVRRLLAADLIATDIYLRDYQGSRVNSAPIGEQIEVVAEWNTQDLPAGTTYDVKFKVNQFELILNNVAQGAGQASFRASLAQIGWYAFEGTNSISVEFDSANSLPEANESNNQIHRTFVADIPTPPSIFQWPLADQPFETYGVSSYNDVDPSSVQVDYLGRGVGVNNHWGWDIGPGPFENSDAALEIIASAAGTVLWAGDGYFDRNFGSVNPSARSNGVVIDHGDGWETLYVHFRRDSVVVKAGDEVAAGQVVGLVGSSGPSGGPHIHYHVTRNGRVIDPMIGRQYYFASDYPDRFSEVDVQNLAVTNRETLDDYTEAISSSRILSPNSQTVFLGFNVFGQLQSEPLKTSIYRPSGELWVTYDIVANGDVGQGTWLPRWNLPSDPEQGRWRVTYEARGELVEEDFFEISTIGLPELSMRYDGVMVTDSRWTPYDFAPVSKNSSSPRLMFTIENHGSAPLEIHGVELPEWVTLTRSPPASLQAGESSTFEIAASTSEAGIRWGQVAVLTNDASERRSTFQVESRITDTALGATRVGLTLQQAIEGQTISAKVYRTFVDGTPLVVDLSTSHPQRLSLPEQVVIPAWEPWVLFDVQVEDDQEVQALTRAEVIAAPKRGFLPSHSELLVIDNDQVQTEVTIDFPTGEVEEYKGTILGLVSRSGDLRDELPVQLWQTDATQVRKPLWVTIPAFRETVEFRLTAIDNNLADGARDVEVVASVFGVASDRASVRIIDDETDSPPTDLSLAPTTISENLPPSSLVGEFSTVDPDPNDNFTYTLVDGSGSDHNADFRIDGQRLLATATFDYEASSLRQIRLRTTDLSGNSIEKQLTISVTDANEPPFALNLDRNSVEENRGNGSHIGWLRVQDPDIYDSHSFSLASGAGDRDNQRFQIVGNSLRTRESFNFESQVVHSIHVRATDSEGLFAEQIFEIEVRDAAEAPTDIVVNPNSLEENAAAGSFVGKLRSIDEDFVSSFTYRLVDGVGSADNERFSIVDDKLFALNSFDHEAQGTQSIRVETTDNTGLTFARRLLISILDVNEHPIQVGLGPTSLHENQSIGTLVGDLSTVDPDSGDTFTYALVVGDGSEGNASFSIGDGLKLLTASAFDHETQSQYNIRVRSTDSGGLSVEKKFVIEITDAAEPPTNIRLNQSSIAENQPVATAVGEFMAVDPDAGDSATFSLAAGTGDTDNALFRIAGNELRSAAVFDFENKSSYSVRVRATDSTGLTFEEVFTVTVTDVNETPTDVTLNPDSVPENNTVGASVGSLTALDPDAGDSFTFVLVAGSGDTDNASFTIDGDTLKTAATFDHETQPTRSIRVEATDSSGLKFTKSILVYIDDVNESPTDVTLSNNLIAENQSPATTIGQLSAIDPDLADEFVFSLIGDSTISDVFTIVGNELRTANRLDFESKAEYLLTVRATDLSGLSVDKEIRISVGDANDTPTEIALSKNSIRENLPVGTLLGELSAVDQDSDDEFSYAFANGAGDNDNASFRIESNKLLTNESFDFEAATTRQIRITVEDSAGATFEKMFVISILDEDEFLPQDVNADFLVSPIDVLLVINHLNSRSSGVLGPDDNPRLDVNRDNVVSPIDALIVINYLNQQGSGEAEQSLTSSYVLSPIPLESFHTNDKWFESNFENYDLRHQESLVRKRRL